jgi:Calx-beta domain/Carboxypeptidase regulatory-like domain
MPLTRSKSRFAGRSFIFALMLIGLISCCVLLSSETTTVLAQSETTTFSVKGRVADMSNNGVADVAITLTLAAGPVNQLRTTQTDASGNYSFNNLPLGQNSARVEPSKTGYTFSPSSIAFVSSRSIDGENTADFTAIPEGTPTPTLQFSRSTYSVNENVPAVGITVIRAGNISVPVSVSYATADLTANAGSDYSSRTGNLDFAAGETTKTFPVSIMNDTRDEADETINLMLMFPTGSGARLVSPATAVLTIVDDDPAPTVSVNNAFVTEGNAGTTSLNFTASLSAASGFPVSVNYATADGTAVSGSDYAAASGTLTFAPGETNKTVSILVNGDLTPEADETFTLALTNPSNASLGVGTGTATILSDDNASVNSLQFSQGSYTVAESAGFLNINVTRSGDLSAPATVKYATSDTTDANYRCDQPTGVASRKCDYHIAVGTLRFAAGESSKQFSLSFINDTYVEGAESFTLALSNPVGSTLGQNNNVTVTVTDDDTGGAANPIDNTSFFVRQLYVDLLSREPDPAGWSGWTSRIDLCGQPGQPPPPCDRVTVGGDGFLRSGEFFDRQFFVLRLYRTGLGRILRYDEIADLAYVSGFLTAEQLELNKQDLVNEMVLRSEFANRYNHLSNASFVGTLLQTADVSVPLNVQEAWFTALNSNAKTRAQVFREISERAEVSNKYLHEAQVVSAYYGFFTRNPDGAYLNYLQRLDSGEINLADLANAFINAQEYRQRFGQ